MCDSVFAIYGASGFGREVMPTAMTQVYTSGFPVEKLYFIDDYPSSASINGHPVLTYEQFICLNATKRFICIAIADGVIRAKVADRLMKDDITPWNVKASNVVIMDNVEIGEGAVLCPFVTLTSNITIGRFFHANIYSYVAHDCRIGDFVTFAPGVKCNGNVMIEDYAYIGAGAVLKQGSQRSPLVVGNGAIVGMGAIVTKSVPAGMTVVGNPARVLEKA